MSRLARIGHQFILLLSAAVVAKNDPPWNNFAGIRNLTPLPKKFQSRTGSEAMSMAPDT